MPSHSSRRSRERSRESRIAASPATSAMVATAINGRLLRSACWIALTGTATLEFIRHRYCMRAQVIAGADIRRLTLSTYDPGVPYANPHAEHSHALAHHRSGALGGGRRRGPAPQSSENGEGEDAVDRVVGLVAGDLDAVVGALVGSAAGKEEVLEALGVAGEGANILAVREPTANHGERHVKPDRNSVVLQQFVILLLGKAAAAERDHHGPPGAHGFHALPDGFRFDLPELGLTALLEDLMDGGLLLGLDILIDVGESPAEFVSEFAADGGLAGGHEAHQVHAGSELKLMNHRCPR